MRDPYLVLGLSTDADDDAVERAYLEAIKRCPPERDAARFSAIRTAYEQLRTRRDRTAFDLFDTTPPGGDRYPRQDRSGGRAGQTRAQPAPNPAARRALMDEATKEALSAQFRAYLDAAGEELPAMGGPKGPTPDLFTLLAELAALKNEVKLESRQVKSALDEFRGLFDTLRESQARLGDEQERRIEQTRAADRQTWKTMLLELLELRDRMQAGHDQAARFRPGWLMRRRREPQRIASLAEGMALTLRRLDETLARRGVRPLPAVGRPFDPQRMHAAELARDPERPTGQVVAELRPGWLLHDELLRPAEVIVNRTDSPKTTETEQ